MSSFAALVDESRRASPPWAIVFVTAVSGTSSAPPDSNAAAAPLPRMVESIRAVALNGLIPFDTSGQAVTLG